MDRDAFRLSSETRVGDGFNPEIALGVAAAINRGEVVRAYRLTGTPALDGGVHKNNVPPVPPQAERTAIGPPETYGFDRESKVLGTQPVGGGGPIEHPFQITDVTDSATIEIQVRFGTVNDDIPDNVATDIALTDDATNYVCLNCTLDVPGDITDSDIEVNTTGLPADDDDSAYILLGTVVCASGAVTTINQAVTHSLRFAACNRTDDGGAPAAVVDRGAYEFWGV